jgi:hypothetical protein
MRISACELEREPEKKSARQGRHICRNPAHNNFKLRQERHIPPVNRAMSLLTELVIYRKRKATNMPRLWRWSRLVGAQIGFYRMDLTGGVSAKLEFKL